MFLINPVLFLLLQLKMSAPHYYMYVLMYYSACIIHTYTVLICVSCNISSCYFLVSSLNVLPHRACWFLQQAEERSAVPPGLQAHCCFGSWTLWEGTISF